MPIKNLLVSSTHSWVFTNYLSNEMQRDKWKNASKNDTFIDCVG